MLSIVSIALLSSAQGKTVTKWIARPKRLCRFRSIRPRLAATGDSTLLASVYTHDAKLTAYWPDPTRPFSTRELVYRSRRT